MLEKIITLLQHNAPKNYFLGLSLLAGQPSLINQDVQAIIQKRVTVDSHSVLRYSSSSYNGQELLNLVSFGLLPYFFPAIKQLDLSYVQTFDGLEQFAAVEEVRFYNNEITALPAQLFQLKKLKHLFIRLNPNLNFDQVCLQLQQFPLLQSLYLENNSLSHVPNHIEQLLFLKTLILSNRQLGYKNQITAIPQNILHLKQLKELSFEGNPINTFPTQLLDFARQQLHIFHIGRYNFLSGKQAVEYLELFKKHGLKTK